MPISIQIHAASLDEFHEYMAALAARVASGPGRVNGESSEPDLNAMLGGEPVDALADAEELPQEAAPITDKPKRTRGRPRKVTQDAPEAAPEIVEETQDEAELAPEGVEANPNPFADEAAEAAVRDPKVDWGLALELLRAVYDRPGAAAKVNAILTYYGVSKFTSIPKDKGTELLGTARALDEEHPAA